MMDLGQKQVGSLGTEIPEPLRSAQGTWDLPWGPEPRAPLTVFLKSSCPEASAGEGDALEEASEPRKEPKS